MRANLSSDVFCLRVKKAPNLVLKRDAACSRRAP